MGLKPTDGYSYSPLERAVTVLAPAVNLASGRRNAGAITLPRIFDASPPHPGGGKLATGGIFPGMKPYNMACRVAQEGFIPWERLYGW